MAAMALQSCVSLKLPFRFHFLSRIPSCDNPRCASVFGRGTSSLMCGVCVGVWQNFRVIGLCHGNVDKD